MLILLSVPVRAQRSSKGRRVGGTGLDVVQTLLPNDQPIQFPRVLPEQRSLVVERLLRDQRRATGDRAQQIAFLLAALGVHYIQNRDYLIHVLRGCDTPSIRYSCSDVTGEFLMLLYKHGHHDLLEPLILIGSGSYNSSLSEGLGVFYGEVLIRHPAEFLSAIRGASLKKQDDACYLAGLADGGGLSPNDLKRARTVLSAVRGELAHRCLHEVESANKSAGEGSK